MSFIKILFFALSQRYLILLIVYLTVISPSYSLFFKYPTAFTLNNGKIFVIHSKGIDICNSKYTTSQNILEF